MSVTKRIYPPPKGSTERFTVEVSAFVTASPETVFETLSQPEGLASIMGCRIEGGLEVGAPIRFVWDPVSVAEGENCDGVCGGEVVAIEPPRRFAFTWGHEAMSRVPWGGSTVELLVAAEAEGARITVRHSNLTDQEEAEKHCRGWAEYVQLMKRRWG